MSIAVCDLTVEIMIKYYFLSNVFYNGDFFFAFIFNLFHNFNKHSIRIH